MKEKDVAVLSHGATGRGNDQMRFERYTNVLAPNMSVYAPWRDAELLEEFPGRTEMAAYLNKFGIEAFVGPKKKYSTDANLAGLSHEAEDLESVETSMLIVEPEMGKWPAEAPDAIEEVELQFEAGRCVAVNGKRMTPLQVITEANAIGGRNGLGVSHALENRIIGTKSRGAASPPRPPRCHPSAQSSLRAGWPPYTALAPRQPSLVAHCAGVYEAPGMQLLGTALTFVYQAVLDRRATKLFSHLSATVADQIYDGRWFDPTTVTCMNAIKELTKHATGRVRVGAYKGNIFFIKMDNVPKSLYNEADSSMEASDGLNPVSSQGYAEIQAVEARSMALAGQIAVPASPKPAAKRARGA